MNALRAHPIQFIHHPHRIHIPLDISRTLHSGHWAVDHPRLLAWLFTGIIIMLGLLLSSIIHISIKTGAWPLWSG